MSEPPERLWVSWEGRIREYVRADLVPKPAPAPPPVPPQQTTIIKQYDGDPKRILRPKEARAKLGVSSATLYRLVKLGLLPPPLKIGRMSGWRQEVLDALGEKTR